MSFCFFTNWIVNYGITRATPNMITTMGWGIFLLYAMLTYVGVGFIWLCMPETKVFSSAVTQEWYSTNSAPRDALSRPWMICSSIRSG